ncbi:MAG: 2,3-bisphosphoglycerate-independent phosphoglycerate mutase, partial [Planctomycetota bacterium]
MRRTALIILDGAGYSTDPAGNGVRPDTLPRVFAAMEQHGFTTLKAHEDAVGLEPGQVGNSEVGHLTIGAGRAVLSMTRRLAAGVESGS